MKKVKIVLCAILLILIIGIIFASENVYAANTKTSIFGSEASKFISLSRVFENGEEKWGYRNLHEQNINDVRVYASDTNTKEISNIAAYCLTADLTYTWNGDNFSGIESNRLEYNRFYDFETEISQILGEYSGHATATKLINSKYYKQIIWLLDNMYMPRVSSNTRKAEIDTIIKKAYEDEGYRDKEIVLTDSDIEAVNQLALWYYTNYKLPYNADNSIADNYNSYNTDSNSDLFLYYAILDSNNMLNYSSLNDYDADKNKQAKILFEYLIDTAESEAGSYEKGGKPIVIYNFSAVSIKKSGQIIVGPIKITKETSTGYELTLNVTNQNNTKINYTITDENGTELIGNSNGKVLTEEDINSIMTGSQCEIYITVSADDAKTVNVNMNTKYNKKTLWLPDNSTSANPNSEQPVIIITPIEKNVKLTSTPEELPFDLALRKYITKVGETTVPTRQPNISTDSLTSGTTATYNHRKDPVIVKYGDTVTYNITIYDEGKKDGYAKQIVDQLPTGLILEDKYIGTTVTATRVSGTGNTYKISYNKENNQIILEATTANALLAYDGTTLDSETIEIVCKVEQKPDEENDIILTNIAWIDIAHDSYDGVDIPNDVNVVDRDSQPENNPGETANELNTNSIGYTGKDDYTSDQLADSSKYYEGEQDDDDFEKLILKPEAFDLALRKYITKVGETTVPTRQPNISTDSLTSGTTATYNHRKDPVIVEEGNLVTYRISIYNEGDRNGYAKQIVDQLPTGLILEDKYIGTTVIATRVSGTGNTYKISYNKENNQIILEATTANALLAYDGTTLDSETIEIVCKVEQKPDEKNNIVLTNIAWIDLAYDSERLVDIPGNDIGVKDRDSEPENNPGETANELNTNSIGYTGKDDYTSDQLADSSKYYEGEQDDDDFEKIILLPKPFDLKLVKYIAKVNSQNLSEEDVRVPDTGIIEIDSTKLKDGTETTANYTLKKDPVTVEIGDYITYTFRIYNEGMQDGYASEITEDIPEGLEFVPDNDTNKKYGWYRDSSDGMVKTTYLSKDNEEDNLISAFDSKNDDGKGSGLDYKEISIVLKVTSTAKQNSIIRNEAAITEDTDKDGDEIDDRDSSPEEWPGREPDHKYEDDEDYDNIKIKIFDLALRKFIIQVAEKSYTTTDKDGNTIYTRAPEVDVTNLYKEVDGKLVTTATYNHTKKPVYAQVGDKVIYIIRVYNEGETDAYIGEITDYLPENLEFVSYTKGDGSINDIYGWIYDEETRKVKTEYLSKENDSENEHLLNAFDKETMETLDYLDVKIECIITDTAEVGEYLTNIAEISEYENKNGEEVNPDNDSTSDNLEYPEDVPSYKQDEIEKDYVPGQEDDDDFEKVIVSEFDLALRKYITKVEDKEVNNRKPVITYENGKITYTHTKEPVLVTKGDVVEYTLVIYNEGTLDGYASEITDYILKNQGLVYANGHEINEEYGWKMYDSDGNETDDVSKAVTIKTDYLSKEAGETKMSEEDTENPNLLKAFDSNSEISETNPDRRILKIAYIVGSSTTSKDILVNIAEISDDSDEDGDEIDDIDSTPGSDKENYPDDGYDTEDHEDDIDYEPVMVTEFDLALKKYVSQAIVIENGKETITETGHTGEENPEPVVKVELDRKNLANVTVKFNYTIKITNEGDIEGYAKEITDYIPAGLRFIAEDNPGWTDEGNNVISTRLLENTLLKPGDSATVTVLLTWINGNDNLGLKVNTAEISEDDNEPDVPDKDSTPDNKVPGEDDIDDAPVILSLKTGSEQTYYILIFVSLITIAGGIFLIKKFVL